MLIFTIIIFVRGVRMRLRYNHKCHKNSVMVINSDVQTLCNVTPTCVYVTSINVLVISSVYVTSINVLLISSIDLLMRRH